MKPSRREQAIRSVIAALLASDLSSHEIQELLESISRSDFLHLKVASLIDAAIDAIPDKTPRKQPFESTPFDPMVYRIYSAVQRKRLSKQEVLEMMQTVISPTEGGALQLERATSLKKIIAHFADHASAQSVSELLKLIESPAESDPYLAGMTKRN
jgi:hypothetical protein